jgi:hypothetical protein
VAALIDGALVAADTAPPYLLPGRLVMRSRFIAITAVLLALPALPAGAAEFNAVSSKDAMRAIAAAGYSGVGGVTRNDPYYFAAAISPDGRRVRIAVDVRSGAIASVTPLPRGAGSITAVPQAPPSYDQPRIGALEVPDRNYYHPPQYGREVGRRYYPWTHDFKPAPGWCRYSASAPNC